MLAKSSKTPHGRILSLFDILGDWINAPNVQIKISPIATHNEQLAIYLTNEAKAIGASSPRVLIDHIVLIARNAALQELNHPNSGSLSHAKKAAQALILAQTEKKYSIPSALHFRPIVFGIASTLFLLIAISALWLPGFSKIYLHPATSIASISIPRSANMTLANGVRKNESKLSALDASIMYAKYEQMRNGTCQFPEALQIPDKDKAVYLENVVGGKLPTNLKDLAIANFYLGKVRCNFTPMLMARSN
jgi:hypothetical protein